VPPCACGTGPRRPCSAARTQARRAPALPSRPASPQPHLPFLPPQPTCMSATAESRRAARSHARRRASCAAAAAAAARAAADCSRACTCPAASQCSKARCRASSAACAAEEWRMGFGSPLDIRTHAVEPPRQLYATPYRRTTTHSMQVSPAHHAAPSRPPPPHLRRRVARLQRRRQLLGVHVIARRGPRRQRLHPRGLALRPQAKEAAACGRPTPGERWLNKADPAPLGATKSGLEAAERSARRQGALPMCACSAAGGGRPWQTVAARRAPAPLSTVYTLQPCLRPACHWPW
jgi:hypothetical protein